MLDLHGEEVVRIGGITLTKVRWQPRTTSFARLRDPGLSERPILLRIPITNIAKHALVQLISRIHSLLN